MVKRHSSTSAALLLTLFFGLFAERVRADDAALLPSTGEVRPAEVYFGAYRNNEPLADHPDQWEFVQKHADGFVMHFGYWLNNDYHADPIGTAKKLAPILRRTRLRTLMEIGWPRSTAPEAAVIDDMGRAFGREFVSKIRAFESGTGVHVDEIECELRLMLFRYLADRNPNWTASDITQQITGIVAAGGPSKVATHAYWPEFLETMRAGLGDRPIDVGCPPVYVPWKGLFTAGRDMRVVRSNELNAAGKPTPGAAELLFDGPTVLDALLRSTTHGFVCDSPWFLMGNDAYVKQGYRRKVVDVGRFVQSRNRVFQFIVNASPDRALPPGEWDRQYAEQSMKSLVAFQLAGGRADRYLFESWYAGPFSIVPETQSGTFTHLVRDGLMYLKGPGQSLRLTSNAGDRPRLRLPGGPGGVTLTNTGTVACLPAIRARSKGEPLRVLLDRVDVSAAAATPEGVTTSALVGPGQSISFDVSGVGTIEAAWNPQEPAATKPRAVIAIDAY